jgi:hypothetical protein
VVPPYDLNGNLPPGEHHTSWSELYARYATSTHRIRLLDGLLEALKQLRTAGCETVWIDGSFITAKAQPDDYDACWNAEHVNPDALDPVLLDFKHPRQRMKRKYHGELFIADALATPEGEHFLEFFQRDRDGHPKGIVRLDLNNTLEL